MHDAMKLYLRTLPLAAVLGLALLAGCDPKSPKVTEDKRPTTGVEQATGTITGSGGTATGTGGAGSTTTPGTPSGSLPEASGPAVSAGDQPTAGRSSGAPLGAGGDRATGGAAATDSHKSTGGEPGRNSGVSAGTAAPPSVAVPASRTASMAAGAGEMANQPATPANRAQAAPGGDAPSRDAAKQSATKLSAAERTFIQNAASLGLYEIAAAQLGQSRAKDPAVRGFAEHMQRDHAKAQEQLQQLARQHGVDLPAQMPPDRLTVIERLQRTEPFDLAFVNTVGIQDHRSVIERFEKAQRDAKDPALLGWIKQTLPTLREHLAQAGKLPGADAEAKSR
jgi:putative membrane protein